jgi:ionotropic glutamate receptor
LSGNYREVLAKIEASGETNVIIACSIDILGDVLEQLQQVGIMNRHYSYIVMSLDFHTLNLKPYQYSGVNITGEYFCMKLLEKLAKNLNKILIKTI